MKCVSVQFITIAIRLLFNSNLVFLEVSGLWQKREIISMKSSNVVSSSEVRPAKLKMIAMSLQYEGAIILKV